MRFLSSPTARRAPSSLLRRTFATSSPRRLASPLLVVSDEVQSALSEKRPVVALESTVYTHGMRSPEYALNLAREMESKVRSNGAIPAHIAILNGKARVGLSAQELEQMADANGKKHVMKISRRDLAYALSTECPETGTPWVGGTTIAGTSALANLAGIKVFATGGLGGVHRGVETTMDVSADLTELGRTAIAVIASGCKSFLDIEKTLEYLETEGVYVGTFGDKWSAEEYKDVAKEIEFPGFYTRKSGFKSPSYVESSEAAARMIYQSHQLGLKSGQFFANPVPQHVSLPSEKINEAIRQVIEETRNLKVPGNKVTPIILKEIQKIGDAQGLDTLKANTELLLNNAVRGAEVAGYLAKLENGQNTSFIPPPLKKNAPEPSSTPASPPPSTEKQTPPSPKVLVIGGVAVDLTCDPSSPPQLHTSNPSTITESLGGVGSNVARALHRSSVPTRLITSIGDDVSGRWILSRLQQEGSTPMDTTGITTSPTHPTARYISFTDSRGGLLTAAADMGIHHHLQLSAIEPHLLPPSSSSNPKYAIIDGNLSSDIIRSIITICASRGIRLIFEPTSTTKSALILPPSRPSLFATSTDLSDVANTKPLLYAISPNTHELTALHAAFMDRGMFDSSSLWFYIIDALNLDFNWREVLVPKISRAAGVDLVADGTMQKAVMLLPFVPRIWLKMGEKGVVTLGLVKDLEARRKEVEAVEGAVQAIHEIRDERLTKFGIRGLQAVYYPPAEKLADGEVVSVNGAGDTFLGVLVAGLVKGRGVPESVMRAQRAAVRTLKSKESVGNVEEVWKEE